MGLRHASTKTNRLSRTGQKIANPHFHWPQAHKPPRPRPPTQARVRRVRRVRRTAADLRAGGAELSATGRLRSTAVTGAGAWKRLTACIADSLGVYNSGRDCLPRVEEREEKSVEGYGVRDNRGIVESAQAEPPIGPPPACECGPKSHRRQFLLLIAR